MFNCGWSGTDRAQASRHTHSHFLRMMTKEEMYVTAKDAWDPG